MTWPEPLIAEYGLTKWYANNYTGSNPMHISNPTFERDARFRGLIHSDYEEICVQE